MLKFHNSVDLSRLNTLRLPSTAANYFILDHLKDLPELGATLANYSCFFVLGGGSNLILPQNYSGLVIHNQLRGLQVQELDAEHLLVTAMAGENWDDFVAYCCDSHAYGLENLSLIPGTVGASPVQNIGAYGVEVKDFIDYVKVYDLEQQLTVQLSSHQCNFSYRNSYLKNNPRYIVLSVSFKLRRQPQLNLNYGDIATQLAKLANPQPHDLRACVIATRRTKLPDPAEIANVGSFFHNPIIPARQAEKLKLQYPKLPCYPSTIPEQVKVSAGWLIDKLGLKGWRSGNVGVYHKQALVLVNHGGATQAELLDFAQQIQAQVQAHYGIQLNIEPIIL